VERKRKRLRFWIVASIVFALLFTVIGLTAIQFTMQSRIEHYADRFLLLSVLRKEALEEYLDTARTEITFWSLNKELQKIQTELLGAREAYTKTGENELARVDYEFALSAIQSRLHVLAKMFLVERSYYDFFLITPEGEVIYTVEKEDDYGTNLLTGPWSDTGLASVFNRAVASAGDGRVVFSDFEAYEPSAGAPAMFMARAMVGPEGRMLGVLALQLPTERIRSIMQFTAGMGESGETYLVGEDLLMRSDSRFSDESTILRVKVDTESVRRALAGESGTLFTSDYRGVPVLSAFSEVTVDDFRWAVMAEIDREEVLRAIAEKRPQIAGLMLFLYSISIWTLWYLRESSWSTGEGLSGHSDIDTPDLGDTGIQG
jgi:methyl-accepting chemotaxis protein